MRLLVGLGNPGDKYSENRHNVGFMVIDSFARKLADNQWSEVRKFNSLIIIHQSSIILCKPQTFMNSIGNAVRKLVSQYKIKIPDLWVIHDDLDLSLGTYKIQKGIGPKLHYGIQSIEKELGTKDFWRIRVGVDNRNLDNRISGERYVLQNFSEEERNVIEKTIDNICNELFAKLVKSNDRETG